MERAIQPKTKNATNKMDMNTVVPTVVKGGVILGSAVAGFVINNSLRKSDIPAYVSIPLSVLASLGLVSIGCKTVDVIGSTVRVKSNNLIPTDLKIIMDATQAQCIQEYCEKYNIDLSKSVANINAVDLVRYYANQTDDMCYLFLKDHKQSTEETDEEDTDVIVDNSAFKLDTPVEPINEQNTSDQSVNHDEPDALAALTEKNNIVDPHNSESEE